MRVTMPQASDRPAWDAARCRRRRLHRRAPARPPRPSPPPPPWAPRRPRRAARNRALRQREVLRQRRFPRGKAAAFSIGKIGQGFAFCQSAMRRQKRRRGLEGRGGRAVAPARRQAPYGKSHRKTTKTTIATAQTARPARRWSTDTPVGVCCFISSDMIVLPTQLGGTALGHRHELSRP